MRASTTRSSRPTSENALVLDAESRSIAADSASRRRAWARLAVAAAVALTFAGCNGDDGDTDDATPDVEETADDQTESVEPTTTTSTSAPTEEESSAALEDGRHFGYITSVDADRSEIEFDLAQWLEGDAADTAAQEDGVVGPGEEVENDYYVRNVNPKLRTLTVGGDATILLVDMESGDVSTPSREVTLEELAGEDLEIFGFWLTLEGGTVVEAEQQYVP